MEKQKPEEVITGLKDLHGLSTSFYDCLAMLSRYLKDPINQLWDWSDKFADACIVQEKTMNARLNRFALGVIAQTSVDSPVSTRYIYEAFFALRCAEETYHLAKRDIAKFPDDANVQKRHETALHALKDFTKKVEAIKTHSTLSVIQMQFVKHLDNSDSVNERTALLFIAMGLSMGLYNIKKIWEIWCEHSTSYYTIEI